MKTSTCNTLNRKEKVTLTNFTKKYNNTLLISFMAVDITQPTTRTIIYPWHHAYGRGFDWKNCKGHSTKVTSRPAQHWVGKPTPAQTAAQELHPPCVGTLAQPGLYTVLLALPSLIGPYPPPVLDTPHCAARMHRQHHHNTDDGGSVCHADILLLQSSHPIMGGEKIIRKERVRRAEINKKQED